MNKDIQKYIANFMLCQQDKAKIQSYPLQMTEILERPFNKITINLLMECEMSTMGNKHILIIIDLLTGWPEAFPIPHKSADTHSVYLHQPLLTNTRVLDISYWTMELNLRTS